MQEPDELSLFAERLEQIGAPYMVTGATAAIVYGQPRVTNDLDVVLSLNDITRRKLLQAFPEQDFYVPPETVIRAEQARSLRGHFNLIHHETGYKADIYLVGQDPLHAWAIPLRRQIPWRPTLSLSFAPPEYVILRKLQYFQEGRSNKHVADIRAMRAGTELDTAVLTAWIARLGLAAVWSEILAAH